MTQASEESNENQTEETPKNEEKKHPAKMKKFLAGDLLIKEGKEERIMYVLKTGKVRVFKTYLGRKLTIGFLSAGEVFGELSFFDGRARIASVEAVEDGEAIMVEAQKVQADLNTMPAWLKSIFKTVVNRLRETDEKLALLQNKTEMANKTVAMAEEVFHEVGRINDLLSMFFEKESGLSGEEGWSIAHEKFQKLLGATFFRAEKIFDAYFQDQIIIEKEVDGKKVYAVNPDEINHFNEYVAAQLKLDIIPIFSRESLNVFSEIIQLIPENSGNESDETDLFEIIDPNSLKSLRNYKDLVKEMRQYKMTEGAPPDIKISLGDLRNHFRYQNFINKFNPNLD